MKFLGGSPAKAIGTVTSITPTTRRQLLRRCTIGFDLAVVAANLTSSSVFGNQLFRRLFVRPEDVLPRRCELIPTCIITDSSCPCLSRASTPSKPCRFKGVDGRGGARPEEVGRVITTQGWGVT